MQNLKKKLTNAAPLLKYKILKTQNQYCNLKTSPKSDPL